MAGKSLASIGILDESASAGSGGGSGGLSDTQKKMGFALGGPLLGGIANKLWGGDKHPDQNVITRFSDMVTGVPGGVMQLGSDVARLTALPYYASKDDGLNFDKTFPAINGLGQGFRQTGEHISAIWNANARDEIVDDYRTDPLGNLVNDASNVAVVVSPVAKATGIAAQSAEAGSMTARLASATEKVAAGANRIGSLPVVPYRYPITRAGEMLGQSTLRGLDAKAGVEGAEAGRLSSVLADRAPGLQRFAPESKALSDALLTGKARETALEHNTYESRLPELQALKEAAPRSEWGRITDEWRTSVRAETDPALQNVRGDTAGGIARLPVSYTRQLVDDPTAQNRQGSLFGEAPAQVLTPVPKGYVRLGDIRAGGNKSTVAPFKGSEAIVVPKPLADQIATFFQGPSEGSQKLGKVVDPFNKVKYATSLGANPAWIAGNTFGNFTMDALHHPIEAVKNYVPNIASKKGMAGLPKDSRLFKAAPVEATIGRQESKLRAGTGNIAERAADKATNAMDRVGFFRMAERLDNAARATFYKAELKQGASPELAMEKTLRAMGEFDKMSPIERDYLKKLAPFYSWHREILKVAKNFAEEHPVAAGQLTNIGREEADQPDSGGTQISGDQFMPFGQAGASFGGPFGGFGKMLGPLPKALYNVGTGDSASGGKDLRAGQEFGESNTPGLHNIDEAAGQFAKGVPQVRLEEALRGASPFHTPKEGLLSFLGIDASHQPPKKSKGGGKKSAIPTSAIRN